MPVHGGQATLENIIAFGGKFLKTVTATMQDAGGILHKQVEKNVSLSDHSLKALKLLDHPYARRHGLRGEKLHDPYWQVHRQSGEMKDALFLKVEEAKASGTTVAARALVGFEEARAPHALYVIFGTSRMIPRDPLQGSLDQVSDRVANRIRATLKNAVVSFRGRGTVQGGAER